MSVEIFWRTALKIWKIRDLNAAQKGEPENSFTLLALLKKLEDHYNRGGK